VINLNYVCGQLRLLHIPFHVLTHTPTLSTTGSGKTCAFLLPVCAALASSNNSNGKNNKNGNNQQSFHPASPRCVVLAPTRELASQIELEAQKLTYGMPSVTTVVVYGGATARPQLQALATASVSTTTALIVVATPGRLADFCDRNIVSLSNVQFLILDEADRMLDMGFMVRRTTDVV
jgi:ATP-dependent RNA helicase DDX3X